MMIQPHLIVLGEVLCIGRMYIENSQGTVKSSLAFTFGPARLYNKPGAFR